MPYFYVYANSLTFGARYLHVIRCLPHLVFLEYPFDLWVSAGFDHITYTCTLARHTQLHS